MPTFDTFTAYQLLDTFVEHGGNFISQGLNLNLAIVPSYSKQYQKPLTYLAHDFSVYSHAGPAHTLE